MKRFFHDMFGWEPLFFASVNAKRLTWNLLGRHQPEEAILMLVNAIEPPGIKTKLVLFFKTDRPERCKWLIGERKTTGGENLFRTGQKNANHPVQWWPENLGHPLQMKWISKSIGSSSPRTLVN